MRAGEGGRGCWRPGDQVGGIKRLYDIVGHDQDLNSNLNAMGNPWVILFKPLIDLYFKRLNLFDGVELGQGKKQGDLPGLVVGDGGLTWVSVVEVEAGGWIPDLFWS